MIFDHCYQLREHSWTQLIENKAVKLSRGGDGDYLTMRNYHQVSSSLSQENLGFYSIVKSLVAFNNEWFSSIIKRK